MAPNNPSYAPRARAPRTHAASNAARLAARRLPLRRASQAAHAASGAPCGGEARPTAAKDACTPPLAPRERRAAPTR